MPGNVVINRVHFWLCFFFFFFKEQLSRSCSTEVKIRPFRARQLSRVSLSAAWERSAICWEHADVCACSCQKYRYSEVTEGTRSPGTAAPDALNEPAAQRGAGADVGL